MASIHKHPQSKYWYCSFRNSNGKRKFVSSRQSDKAKAQLICTALQKTADDYGERMRTVSHLRKTLNGIATLVGGETIKEYSVREWFNLWASDKLASQATGTGKRYSGLVREFLKELKDGADGELSTLTAEDIKMFRDKQLKAGISNSSANLLLKTIRTCLRLAVSQGHLAFNRAEAVTLLPKNSTTRRAFARADLQRLLEVATGEWRGLILAGYYIGARLGSLVRLKHEEIDYARGLLTYTPNKQKVLAEKKTVTIPLHPEFLAYLNSTAKSSGPVFPTLIKQTIGGDSGLSLTFRALLDQAGINYTSKEPSGKKGRKVHSLGFHSLRRTFNSVLANASVSQEIRQKLIGHASREVNDGYTELELKMFRTAIDCLDPLGPSPSPVLSQAFSVGGAK
jgi:integrase